MSVLPYFIAKAHDCPTLALKLTLVMMCVLMCAYVLLTYDKKPIARSCANIDQLVVDHGLGGLDWCYQEGPAGAPRARARRSGPSDLPDMSRGRDMPGSYYIAALFRLLVEKSIVERHAGYVRIGLV